MEDAKLIIIYGDDKIDDINKNGNYDCLGHINTDDLHISCFLDYFKYNFLQEPIFKNVIESTISINIGYVLAQKGHISFFNTTREVKPKSGFFMLPPDFDKITIEQKEIINKIIKVLKGYNIRVLYDYFINDYGLLDSKSYYLDEFISIDDFLTSYKFIKKFKLI